MTSKYVRETTERIIDRLKAESGELIIVERTAEAEQLGRKRNAEHERAERLKVEVDACHAALRTLLGAIPACDCSTPGFKGWDCVQCDLEYEIGIANNILNNPPGKFPELCGPILTKPRVLQE